METFKDNIRKWVELDNMSYRYKLKMDELKKKKDKYEQERNKLQDNVLSFMENNKLEDNEIVISDGKLKYFNSKSSTSVSQKFIQERLKLYFKDKEKAAEITEFIYNGREVSFTPVIKRTRQKLKSDD
jgi:uncharacterized coiled-coil DUF342 family protein